VVIIAGHLLVEPAEGDAYVDAMRDLVTRARAFDGCIHLAITADSVDPDRTNNIEIWRDARALNRWCAVANARSRLAHRRQDESLRRQRRWSNLLTSRRRSPDGTGRRGVGFGDLPLHHVREDTSPAARWWVTAWSMSCASR